MHILTNVITKLSNDTVLYLAVELARELVIIFV